MDNGASSYRRFLNGDESGFIEIVRDYKDGLILYLDSFVGNIYTAEELAEDVFVKLGIKKPHFSERSSFKTWLYAIGRNAALDCIRRQKKCDMISDDEFGDIADAELLEESYICEERKRTVHKVMKRLKEEYRQVLWLVYFEGFSTKETAKIMKKSPHGIETLIYRARLSLKSELEKEEFDHEDL